MSWSQPNIAGLEITNTSSNYSFLNFVQRPLEMYVFIDPLCPNSWSLEPYLKKLSIEYGRYFTVRTIISGQLSTINKNKWEKQMECINKQSTIIKKTEIVNDLYAQTPVIFPWVALAIKAAELQGRSAGRAFLRKLRVNFFLKYQDVSEKSLLIRCAEEAKLDLQEFKNDIFSNLAKKAFQCDLSLKKEMEVEGTPTIVFFNQVVEDQGIKIDGIHSYHTYVHIIREMLQMDPSPSVVPPLEDFLEQYDVVSDDEISVIYGWTLDETTRRMKKLELKQKVRKTSMTNGAYWKYIKKI